jgi:hypothetical protein
MFPNGAPVPDGPGKGPVRRLAVRLHDLFRVVGRCVEHWDALVLNGTTATPGVGRPPNSLPNTNPALFQEPGLTVSLPSRTESSVRDLTESLR